MRVCYLIHPEHSEVLAYFPTEEFDNKGNKMSYQHIGQHGACSVEYAKECRDATPDEYEALHKELTTMVGYEGLVIKSINDPLRVLRVCAKCVDMFNGILLVDGKKVKSHDGYVPDFMPGEHYGDYVEMDIDLDTGEILNWIVPDQKDVLEQLNGE